MQNVYHYQIPWNLVQIGMQLKQIVSIGSKNPTSFVGGLLTVPDCRTLYHRSCRNVNRSFFKLLFDRKNFTIVNQGESV
jgi:hypothetical protein